jgi:hypothetical protein
MRPLFGLALLLAFGLTACGGGQRAVTPEASIPASVAERLASRSEAIAASLDAGDQCGAAQQADELKHAAEDAIAQGQVPSAFQDELEQTAVALQNDVNCDDSKGHGEGKDKKDDKDEPGLTITTNTTATETETD